MVEDELFMSFIAKLNTITNDAYQGRLTARASGAVEQGPKYKNKKFKFFKKIYR